MTYDPTTDHTTELEAGLIALLGEALTTASGAELDYLLGLASGALKPGEKGPNAFARVLGTLVSKAAKTALAAQADDHATAADRLAEIHRLAREELI